MSEPISTAFHVEIFPSRGAPYSLDLSEFALGGNATTVKKMTAWGGDYSGRPRFASEIVDLFSTLNPPEKTATKIRSALRLLFRYLDHRASKDSDFVSSCTEMRDSHGVELRQWLAGSGSAFKDIKTTLDKMRALNGSRQLFWPGRRKDGDGFRKLQDEEGLRRLFHALRHEARAIKAMFAEGDLLASRGSDPRLLSGDEAWASRENRAWLVKLLLEKGVPDRDALSNARAGRLILGPGATYLAPGMDRRYVRGLAGALRWFVPTRSDTGVVFWLFLLGTGWNLSTACGIDALDPEGWCQPHPQSDMFTVIHAFKRRSDRHQFAISMTRPEWHPYRILQFMIERTAPLRKHVLDELAKTRRRAAADPRLKLEREIDRLERLSRTPWLFASRGQVGTISGFIGDSDRGLLEVARALAETTGLADRHLALASIVTKDARQAWIGHAYVQSGYNMLLTKLAGSHATLRSTKHYIRSTRYRAYSEAQVRKLQDAVFSELECGQVLDPTRLRLLVANGKITLEQEARLSDFRQRTRIGMGCLDPRSPPKVVDPDHREGSLCRVQRCTGCPHGIVFPESMSPLARRYAELLHLQRTMPMASWSETSLADEHQSIELTLKGSFDAGRVATEVAAWSEKLKSGEIQVHGTYPSY